MMRAIILAACLGAVFVSVAAAQTPPVITQPTPGWTFYNRPGATLAQHQADIESCFDPVAAMTPPGVGMGYDYFSPQMGATYGMAGALGGAMLAASAQAERERMIHNAAIVANYENCMVGRGWRVVRLSPAAGRRLEALDRSHLQARLEPMIAAEQPEGDIVRAFSNDLAHPQTPPAHPDNTRPIPLSLLTLPVDGVVGERLRREPPPVPGSRASLDARRAAEARDRDRLHHIEDVRQRTAAAPSNLLTPIDASSTVTSDLALIVVSISRLGTLTFERERASETDARASFTVTLSAPKAGEPATGQSTFVFAAPPGRWRIRTVSFGPVPVSLCMGAPAFDVAAGEVVFAGAFGEENVGPDLTPSAAEAALASAPAFVGQARPASYINGSVSECANASFLYAYEIADAPFAEDYHWGSRFGAPTGPAPAPAAQ